ncbi:MAG: zinc-ribbon domain-containing protein [Dehalococcoidia bacterium]|nr:zinc-ribbon domain-containing protein [Dehalococcoidia bacterium]
MFCSQCGVEVADAAAFCRKCGASLRDDVAPPAPQPVEQQPPAQQVYQQPTPQQQVMTQQRPAATQTMRHTLGATKPVQPAIGVAVMIGSALAVIGTMVPWIDFAGATANGFDGGYLTGSSMGDGNDGIVILLLGLAAGALAVHYFMKPNPLLSLGSLILGAAAAGVAGYDLVRLISDIRDGCGGCNVMDYLGFGLYVSIAGGAIAAGAAFMGFRREGSM